MSGTHIFYLLPFLAQSLLACKGTFCLETGDSVSSVESGLMLSDNVFEINLFNWHLPRLVCSISCNLWMLMCIDKESSFSGVYRLIVLAFGNVLIFAGSPVNGEASSPPPAMNDNRPSGDNLDTILFQLRQVTRERDDLRKRLALASPGTTFDDCRYKPGPACLPSFCFFSKSHFYLADAYELVHCDL